VGADEVTSTYFEASWVRANPLTSSVAGDVAVEGDPDRVDEADAQLLALMLSGLADQAVASQLGTSVRSVQRRIAALMDRAGVQTRIQVGWHASRNGWARATSRSGAEQPALLLLELGVGEQPLGAQVAELLERRDLRLHVHARRCGGLLRRGLLLGVRLLLGVGLLLRRRLLLGVGLLLGLLFLVRLRLFVLGPPARLSPGHPV
jgi:hypothetical protein